MRVPGRGPFGGCRGGTAGLLRRPLSRSWATTVAWRRVSRPTMRGPRRSISAPASVPRWGLTTWIARALRRSHKSPNPVYCHGELLAPQELVDSGTVRA